MLHRLMYIYLFVLNCKRIWVIDGDRYNLLLFITIHPELKVLRYAESREATEKEETGGQR